MNAMILEDFKNEYAEIFTSVNIKGFLTFRSLINSFSEGKNSEIIEQIIKDYNSNVEYKTLDDNVTSRNAFILKSMHKYEIINEDQFNNLNTTIKKHYEELILKISGRAGTSDGTDNKLHAYNQGIEAADFENINLNDPVISQSSSTNKQREDKYSKRIGIVFAILGSLPLISFFITMLDEERRNQREGDIFVDLFSSIFPFINAVNCYNIGENFGKNVAQGKFSFDKANYAKTKVTNQEKEVKPASSIDPSDLQDHANTPEAQVKEFIKKLKANDCGVLSLDFNHTLTKYAIKNEEDYKAEPKKYMVDLELLKEVVRQAKQNDIKVLITSDMQDSTLIKGALSKCGDSFQTLELESEQIDFTSQKVGVITRASIEQLKSSQADLYEAPEHNNNNKFRILSALVLQQMVKYSNQSKTRVFHIDDARIAHENAMLPIEDLQTPGKTIELKQKTIDSYHKETKNSGFSKENLPDIMKDINFSKSVSR